jgi:hypothetical protein
MVDQTQVGSGNSAARNTQSSQREEGQFGDRNSSITLGTSPDWGWQQSGSKIPDSNSITSRAIEQVAPDPLGPTPGTATKWATVGIVAAAVAGVVGLALWRRLRGAPNPLSPDQILEGALKKAFNDKLSNVHTKLPTMTLGEARGVWQTIANEVAVDCFDRDGKIDEEKLKAWMELLRDTDTFKEQPLCFIPHAELMRSQMYRVCECLLNNKNDVRNKLNAANNITVGSHGKNIVETMSQGRESLLTPGEAILASLFTPHRQQTLPTCTIHAIINAETQNHPEEVISMYTQMLSNDQFTFPSGYANQQQLIVNGFVMVDLKNGSNGRDFLFANITSNDTTKIADQKSMWQMEGIEYIESTDPAEQYKLKLPIHNMNDILFVHLLQASTYGNRKIDSGNSYGTTKIYTGHHTVSHLPISVHSGHFLAGIAGLKADAEAQRKLGLHFMRVFTTEEVILPNGQSHGSGHAENIDIAALLALDTNTMASGEAYPIGDRNWANWNVSQDIPRLAVRKMDGTPQTFEFGTLCGTSFRKNELLTFVVQPTDPLPRDAAYWATYRP